MKNKKGFTLVELITVIALLGVIMLLVVPNVVESFSNAKKNTLIIELKTLIYFYSNKNLLIFQ